MPKKLRSINNARPRFWPTEKTLHDAAYLVLGR